MAQALQRAMPQVADARKVASPNRTPSAQLAGDAVPGGRIPNTALQLVDAKGRLVGRYHQFAVVLPFRGQLLTLPLQGDWNEQLQRPNSSGFTWARVGLFYATPDCTGQAYFWTSAVGTRYAAATVLDDGQYYAYIGEPGKAVNVTIASYFDSNANGCYPYAADGQPYMALTDVVPLASLGQPPFMLK